MNPVEWLIYAAAHQYRSDPAKSFVRWLRGPDVLYAAIDVISMGCAARGVPDIWRLPLAPLKHPFLLFKVKT